MIEARVLRFVLVFAVAGSIGAVGQAPAEYPAQQAAVSQLRVRVVGGGEPDFLDILPPIPNSTPCRTRPMSQRCGGGGTRIAHGGGWQIRMKRCPSTASHRLWEWRSTPPTTPILIHARSGRTGRSGCRVLGREYSCSTDEDVGVMLS